MTTTKPITTDAEPWMLGIDFGTTYMCAAVREGGQIREMQVDGYARMPSAVFLDQDGELLVGRAAESRGAIAPERFEPTPKRYLEASEDGILLGDQLLPASKVVGAVLRVVWNEALLQHGGRRPEEIRLTHPATWQDDRKRLLLDAAAEAGMPVPMLVPEPEAAAIGLARLDAATSLGQGALTLVADLGGGTCDVSILKRTGNRFQIVGPSRGADDIGGQFFEDHLYAALGRAGLSADEWERLQNSDDVEYLRANHEFRRRIREAKEAVSKVAAHPVVVPAPISRELQVTRSGFEDLIREDIQRVLDIAMSALAGAGVTASQLSAVYLVGGSSRIPLVLHMARECFGQAQFKGDPKAVVAQGAVAFDSALMSEPQRREAEAPKRRPWWHVPAAATGAALVAIVLFVVFIGGQKTISGRVLDSDGKPISDLPVSVSASLMGGNKNWKTETDDDGVWKVKGDAEKLQPLSLYVTADLEYGDGKVWKDFVLTPLDESGDLEKRIDYEVKIQGENSGYGYSGGSVYVSDAGEWGGGTIAENVGADATVTLQFTPYGSLLDGTDAKPFTYELPAGELAQIDDVPLGLYDVTGEVTVASTGETIPVVFEEDDAYYTSETVDFYDDPTTGGVALDDLTLALETSVGALTEAGW